LSCPPPQISKEKIIHVTLYHLGSFPPYRHSHFSVQASDDPANGASSKQSAIIGKRSLSFPV